MDFFSLEFLTALLTIVFIDLILAGDNAIVIGLAARKLPKEQQKKAVIWGTVGAVAIRAVATVLVVYLLKVPWLMVVGGVLLLWIAYKLLVDSDEHDDVQAGNSLWQSVRTIIIADAAMGIDNVIAVAGAGHGNILLVVLGLVISIPIVVWGSTLFIKVISSYPWIVYIGSAVIAYTAAKMITHEKRLEELFDASPAFEWSFMILVVIAVIAFGLRKNLRRGRSVRVENSRETH
ncbi:TerC family protein [Paenibacillus sacheonensis]|uniref:YjbE family putative metal transport protein n=1 Tax=Paenibacillus sacheonensis TaxID=742054 RepID=A0A7X4YTG5_9BACL|nr:TerC family protein [Paenibacillus sacheonensis]MBM7565676.1 YjbE family integral membrane protein [Paenibacillus sacheonensis]NBC72266.1 YjbE family putative metal transport protein [Paenibacillus sacheonensis]